MVDLVVEADVVEGDVVGVLDLPPDFAAVRADVDRPRVRVDELGPFPLGERDELREVVRKDQVVVVHVGDVFRADAREPRVEGRGLSAVGEADVFDARVAGFRHDVRNVLAAVVQDEKPPVPERLVADRADRGGKQLPAVEGREENRDEGRNRFHERGF